MEASPDRFERLLRAHLEVNPKSWAALQARGVDEGTPLRLNFEYTAPGEAEVRSLLAFLRTETDYDFQGGARDEKDGTQHWLVLGTTSPIALSLERLNDWVTHMTAYGRDHGPAEFDGWGARTPESAPPAAPEGSRALLGRMLRARRRG
ncbi:MAG: ribonuclease E inhibitor RraB [Solirubrobacteraceae bacterium]